MKILAGGCRVFGPGDGTRSNLANCITRSVINRANGAVRITQNVCEYTRGRSETIVSPAAEEVLYVASGRGVCHLGGFPYPLRPGTGVFIPPGAGYSIENQVSEPLLIVSSCCPEDPDRHLVPEPVAPPSGDPPRRIVHEADREVIRAGKDREFRYLVHTDLGCRQVTQFVGMIPPSKAPFHFHEYEESVFVLEGSGRVHVESESCDFGPRSSIYFPKGVRHCVENPGDAPVRLLGVFYPSGSPSAAYED